MIPFNMGLNTDKAVEQETVTEAFEGYVECLLFAQECRIVLETDGLVFAGRFQQVDVMYGEITAIYLADYLLTLTTDSGRFTISRMGQKLQWLYEKLYAAYNDAVLEALQFVGRAIHTSWEHWKKDIENCCRNTVNTFPGNKQVTEKHCATCGAICNQKNKHRSKIRSEGRQWRSDCNL